MTDTPYIRAERIVVQDDRMVITVALAPGAPHFMTPELAQTLVRMAPELPHHACKNALAPTFSAVMAHTSVPHVLEHLVIDAQCHYDGENTDVRAEQTGDTSTGNTSVDAPAVPSPAAPSPAVPDQPSSVRSVPDDFLFIGTTEWIDEHAGRAQVVVNFADDITALRSLRDALAILNALLAGSC